MIDLLPNARYERKFVAQTYSLADALAAVRLHPAFFREMYPPRTINNIYLDTPNLRAYYEHVNGAANRVKTRIRWYGALSGAINTPTLERKLKRGLVGGKAAYALQPIHVNGSVPRDQITEALIGANAPEPLRDSWLRMRPTLVNRYERHYFLSADGLFRLTVDSRIGFYNAGPASWSAPILPRHAGVVIELKFDTEHAEQAAEITNRLPFRVTRCSKYVMGIEAVGRF